MIWWIVATLCAFFIKGLCGFANTLIFTTILSFGNNNINISPGELILGYPTNLILAWKERRSIKWGICIPLAVMVIVGSIPGALFLKNVDTGLIKVIFGFVIVGIGIEMLLREIGNKKMKQSRLVLGIIGILSGLLCGLYGVGALLGAYVNRVTGDSHSFKANICIVFLVENTFRIVLYVIWGIITFDILKQTIFLVPFMLIGLALGMLGSRILNEKLVKKAVIVMLIVSGIALIINSSSICGGFKMDLSQDYRKVKGIEQVIFRDYFKHDTYCRSFWGLKKVVTGEEGEKKEEAFCDVECLNELGIWPEGSIEQMKVFPDGQYLLYQEIEYDYSGSGMTDDEYCYYRVVDTDSGEIITIYQGYREWYEVGFR